MPLTIFYLSGRLLIGMPIDVVQGVCRAKRRALLWLNIMAAAHFFLVRVEVNLHPKFIFLYHEQKASFVVG